MHVIKPRNKTVMTLAGTTFSPADATTYYFGSLYSVAPTTFAANERFYSPVGGVIRAANVFFNQTAGSNETSTIYIRVNNTTDTVISSAVTNDSSTTSFLNTSLNVPIAAGDYVEVKWITPTWATNPVNLRPVVTIHME